MAEPMFAILASTRQPGTCRSCNAPIEWARTYPKDKAMPINRGAVALKTDAVREHGTIEFIGSADSHFNTCPQSKKWSKR